MAVVELFVDSTGSSKATGLIHKDSEMDGLAVLGAVGSDEEFHLSVSATVAVVVVIVVSVVVASTVVVEVVLQCI